MVISGVDVAPPSLIVVVVVLGFELKVGGAHQSNVFAVVVALILRYFPAICK